MWGSGIKLGNTKMQKKSPSGHGCTLCVEPGVESNSLRKLNLAAPRPKNSRPFEWLACKDSAEHFESN